MSAVIMIKKLLATTLLITLCSLAQAQGVIPLEQCGSGWVPVGQCRAQASPVPTAKVYRGAIAVNKDTLQAWTMNSDGDESGMMRELQRICGNNCLLEMFNSNLCASVAYEPASKRIFYAQVRTSLMATYKAISNGQPQAKAKAQAQALEQCQSATGKPCRTLVRAHCGRKF